MPQNLYHGLWATQEQRRRGAARAAPLADLLAQDLCKIGTQFHARGWLPATSGNLSVKLDRYSMLLTRSGVHKGELNTSDILRASMEGRSLSPGLKPSAEAALHSQLYRFDADIHAVLHTHSPAATRLSLDHGAGNAVTFDGYEIAKALGTGTHAVTVKLPVFANDQDIDALAARLQPELDTLQTPGFLIEGHGLYAWGETLEDARRHIEAWEFLCECERLGGS